MLTLTPIAPTIRNHGTYVYTTALRQEYLHHHASGVAGAVNNTGTRPGKCYLSNSAFTKQSIIIAPTETRRAAGWAPNVEAVGDTLSREPAQNVFRRAYVNVPNLIGGAKRTQWVLVSLRSDLRDVIIEPGIFTVPDRKETKMDGFL